MNSLVDMAAYLLKRIGGGYAPTMKLHRLIYLADSHSIDNANGSFVDETPIDKGSGPIYPRLFETHKHEFVIKDGYFDKFSPKPLTDDVKLYLDYVIDQYGNATGAQLAHMTHILINKPSLAALEILWEDLGDIAIDDDECIDTPFYIWPEGTPREEIWHWFDEHYDPGVAYLMGVAD